MYCSHCGSAIDDDAKFCVNCGKPVDAPEDDGFNTIDGVPLGENDVTAKLNGAAPASSPASAPVPSPAQYSEQERAQAAAAEKRGLSNGVIIAIVAVVAAILVVGGAFIYNRMEQDSAERAQAEAKAAQEQADADATAAAAAEQQADAEKKLTVTLAGSDTSAFPSVSASIKVVDGNGNAVTSLSSGDIKVTEACADGSSKSAAVTSFVSNGGGAYQLGFTAQASKDSAEQRTATIACASANYEWDEIGVTYTAPAKEKKAEGSSGDSKQTTTTQVLVVTTDKSADYMLPSSDCAYYSESDIKGLSDWELYLARNEIYARHGRGFSNDDLQRYFNGKSWYRRTCDPDKFDESVLNKYEKANAAMILAREKAIGSQYI